MTKEEKARAKKLRTEGFGYRAISSKLGVPLSTVSTFFARLPSEPEDVCLQCGVKLEQIPHKRKKKFCSDRCRMLWWNSHLNQVNRQAYYRLVCNQCGKEFISYGNNRRKYCSKECYVQHQKK